MGNLSKDIICIILAAGKGKRMRSQTPKVLHEVCGVPMIFYVIDAVKKAGINKIIVVAGYKAQILKDKLKSEINPTRKKLTKWVNPVRNFALRNSKTDISNGVKVIIQEKLLGTADAIKIVKKKIRNLPQNILVIHGDIPLITSSTLKKLINKHISERNQLTLTTVRLEDPAGYGRIIRDKDNNIVKIVEDEKIPIFRKRFSNGVNEYDDSNEINAGIYCFQTNALFQLLRKITPSKKCREFYLTDIIYWFSTKRLKINSINSKNTEEIIGVNTRKDLAYAEKIMRKNIIDKFMEQGVTFIDPDATYIQSGSRIGKDTLILPNTHIEKNVIIGKNCIIGPSSNIRARSVIADKVWIGNFVEIVRSRIGTGAKIKHFSYIGDAKVGRYVNIGAGAIIANYDGQRKYKTVIEDNVFIGSGTILIAPVKVCHDAITGAGSVVTKGKNVPVGATVVGVPARVVCLLKEEL